MQRFATQNHQLNSSSYQSVEQSLESSMWSSADSLKSYWSSTHWSCKRSGCESTLSWEHGSESCSTVQLGPRRDRQRYWSHSSWVDTSAPNNDHPLLKQPNHQQSYVRLWSLVCSQFVCMDYRFILLSSSCLLVTMGLACGTEGPIWSHRVEEKLTRPWVHSLLVGHKSSCCPDYFSSHGCLQWELLQSILAISSLFHPTLLLQDPRASSTAEPRRHDYSTNHLANSAWSWSWHLLLQVLLQMPQGLLRESALTTQVDW